MCLKAHAFFIEEKKMPTYQYRCTSCEKEEEVLQKITENAITTCPFCKKETFTRIPARSLSIQFKGSGYYKTDYTEKPKEKDCGGSCSCH